MRDAKVVTSAADAGSVFQTGIAQGWAGKGEGAVFKTVRSCRSLWTEVLKSDKAVYFCGNLLIEALDVDFTWFCLI